VERYEIAIAAERAGTSVEELRGLVDLGILQLDADGRFSDGDIRRVGVVHSLVTASIPLDLLASALRSGDLSFDFIDDPSYSLFASYSDETFEELSSKGVKFVSDVLEFPWGSVAQFEDPDGNRLQIREGR